MRKAVVPFTILFCAVFSVQAAADETAEGQQIYEVERGDRFATLSERFGVTPEEIRAANPGGYGISCKNPHRVTLRDGTVRAICGRPRYYLIAGKTLVIPRSRLAIESENADLNIALTTAQAEISKARQDTEALEEIRAERDALRAERDRLASENEELRSAKQELQGRYDELTEQADSAESYLLNQPDVSGAPQNSGESRGEESSIEVILIFLGSTLIVIVFLYLTRSGKRNEKLAKQVKVERERLEQDKTQAEETHSQMVKEGLELADRRRDIETIEIDLERRNQNLDMEVVRLQHKRDEFTRWEEKLEAREKVASKKEAELIERERQLIASDAKPRVPTKIGVPPIFSPAPSATAKDKTQLGLLQAFVSRGLQLIKEEQVRINEARQRLSEEGRTLAGREAACTARERSVTRQAEALDALQKALGEREQELAEKERGVEALRQSLAGQKAQANVGEVRQDQRGHDLAQGFADLAEQRKRLSAELDLRRAELDRLKAEIDGRIRMYDEDVVPEIARREAALSEKERLVGERAAENDRRAAALDAEERDYERRLQEMRDFEGELDRRAEHLAAGEQKLLAEQLEFKNQHDAFANEVSDAKSILVRAKRKKAVVEALDAREAAITSREIVVSEREKALDDRVANLSIWEERLKDKVRDIGDDDVATVVAGGRLAEAIDQSEVTHIDPPGSEPTMAVQTQDVLSEARLAVSASQVEPPPETSGSTEPDESPSCCICPQCRKSIPWEEIDTHECGENSTSD